MGNMTEQIIAGAAITSAVGVLLTAIVTSYKFIRKWDKWREDKDRHDKENYLSIQQLKIMSPFMPLSERVKAGEIYIRNGGNGEVRHKYNELVEELLGYDDLSDEMSE